MNKRKRNSESFLSYFKDKTLSTPYLRAESIFKWINSLLSEAHYFFLLDLF